MSSSTFQPYRFIKSPVEEALPQSSYCKCLLFVRLIFVVSIRTVAAPEVEKVSRHLML